VTVMLLMLLLNMQYRGIKIRKHENFMYLKLYSRSISSRYVLIFELYKVIETSKIMANANKYTSVNGIYRIYNYLISLIVVYCSTFSVQMLYGVYSDEVYHPEVF